MSQSSKHVDWCLSKAKKEIEECEKQGKRLKHRGLLRVNPSLEEARKHLAKAEHDFQITFHHHNSYIPEIITLIHALCSSC